MFITYLKAIGIGDVLDVALVAILIYAVLIWFERARAAFVVRGMLVTGAVYLLARVTGMEMATTLFHAIFAILAVAMVVIFQEELRRVFERIAVWSLSGGKVRRTASTEGEMIVGVAFELAREKMGALIVLRGHDPLERHLHGGWPLQGALSEPLLKSIFDRHSIGHDGAVIIDGHQVTHFGCRLPLSRDVQATLSVGTRHTAALGLSELSDALCIVVSEERGVVSVAYHGQLEQIDDADELALRVAAFNQEMQPPPATNRLHNLRTRKTRQKALAFVSALVLWLVFVFSAEHAEHEFEVPVMLTNAPQHLTVTRVEPKMALVTIDAQIGDYIFEDTDTLAVRIDLAGVTAGTRRFELAPAHIRRPPDFALLSVDPTVIEVELAHATPRAASPIAGPSVATEAQ